MDDPWDVKSVRQAGQYTSCMKLNGVPLLPPVLSKECRKEMQYYKLLAKEVEKRISILQPYIEDSDESTEDRTNALELSEHEQNYVKRNTNFRNKELSSPCSPKNTEQDLDIYDSDSAIESSFVVDFSLRINQTNVRSLETKQRSPSPPIELPERDYDCINQTKELILDTETNRCKISDIVDISFSINKEEMLDPFAKSMSQDEPHSISSKSFTGSLNDLYTESIRENGPQLVRQRSYTVLNPSPQLLAHLEVQSMNTGVDMASISMSESLSNLSSPNKKRRSWDLESAKVKWSSMALELRQKQMGRAVQSTTKKRPQQSPQRGNSVAVVRGPLSDVAPKATPKSEPIRRARRPSPLRYNQSNKTTVKDQLTSKTKEPMSAKSPKSPNPQLNSESENPAIKVRELYEKIQNQQLIQMASLVEKQKREQMLLQQVFEEQNNLLFKQLKTICPKSPIEVKEAWNDKGHKSDHGPVSLSQLMDNKPLKVLGSPSVLTDTNKYLEHCNNALKRSRNLSKSLSKTPNSSGAQSPTRSCYQSEGSRTRTHSPTQRNASRRLNYETSASSEKENEPILTDRTNDTMADLNVTFPLDSDEGRCVVSANHGDRKDVTVIHATPLRNASRCPSTDSAIRCMERTIQNSINSCRRGRSTQNKPEPSPEQRAAASRIVAYVRGYLVRRLFRTERVQSTVQTIKDALLCALQLHQDREGIRGADVDLHRRLIQQITAACYSLHDTFITSTAAERCAMIAADRARRRALAAKPPAIAAAAAAAARSARIAKTTRDMMSQSHCGAFPARPKRSPSASLMTQSTYESYNPEKARPRYMPSPRRRPWR